MSCNVCCGWGRYPVIDRHGSELYTISCPECFGFGQSITCDEVASQAVDYRQRAKYDQAMAQKSRAALQEGGGDG